MGHRIQCRCGALSGEVSHTGSALRAVCYCRDCRAYAIHLGKPETVLDALGGTEVVATQAGYVTFDRGVENLACLSLTPNGTLRWYAKCCNTPIGNTPRDWRLPYVGLVHSCLEKPLERSFPGAPLPVNTASTRGTPPGRHWSQILKLFTFIPQFAIARITGAYKRTPFFSRAGTPVTGVTVLSAAERQRAMDAT